MLGSRVPAGCSVGQHLACAAGSVRRGCPHGERALQAQFSEVSEQVEIMKTTLSKSGNDHASVVGKTASLQAELAAKRSRLDEIRSRVAANHRKLESEYSHLGTLAEKEKELAALSDLEDRRLVEVPPRPPPAMCACAVRSAC